MEKLTTNNFIEKRGNRQSDSIFPWRLVTIRAINCHCQENNALIIDSSSNGLGLLCNIDLPVNTIVVVKLDNSNLALAEVVNSDRNYDPEYNLTRLSLRFTYKEDWPQLQKQSDKEMGSNVIEGGCGLSPCLAQIDKRVDCQYITHEPEHYCSAPASVRASRCLTF